MEWHNQSADQKLLKSLENDLIQFQKNKLQRWEKVVEKVQMSIHPGTPSEDWIIPPDENVEKDHLEKDPEYVKLRHAIQGEVCLAKKCALFLDYNTHHRLDWIKFDDPLIGNDALEDGIGEIKELQERCNSAWYLVQNLKHSCDGFLTVLKRFFSGK